MHQRGCRLLLSCVLLGIVGCSRAVTEDHTADAGGHGAADLRTDLSSDVPVKHQDCPPLPSCFGWVADDSCDVEPLPDGSSCVARSPGGLDCEFPGSCLRNQCSAFEPSPYWERILAPSSAWRGALTSVNGRVCVVGNPGTICWAWPGTAEAYNHYSVNDASDHPISEQSRNCAGVATFDTMVFSTCSLTKSEPGFSPGALNPWRLEARVRRAGTEKPSSLPVLNAGLVASESGVYALDYQPPQVAVGARNPLTVALLPHDLSKVVDRFTLVVDLPEDPYCIRADVGLATGASGDAMIAELISCQSLVDGEVSLLLAVHRVVSDQVQTLIHEFDDGISPTKPGSEDSFRLDAITTLEDGTTIVWVYHHGAKPTPGRLWRIHVPDDLVTSMRAVPEFGTPIPWGTAYPWAQVAAKGKRAFVRLHVYEKGAPGHYESWLFDDHGRVETTRIIDLGLAFAFWQGSSGASWPRGFVLARVLPYGILLTDDWGHPTCEESGVCAALTYEDCDDDNPCTKNLCEPDVGCVNPLWDDGTYCGPGMVCQSGSCVPEG